MKLLRNYVMAAALLLAGPVAVSAQTTWHLPSAYPADNMHGQALAHFAKRIEEGTGGEIRIALHPNASLFKAPEIKRAVQTGQAQAGEVLMSIHENENPIFGIDGLPFLATSYDEVDQLWTLARPEIEKALADQGLTLLYSVPWPPQGLYANKAVNSVADLRGTKWRAYNAITARLAGAIEAQPVTVQAAELPQAFATGVINTAMMSAQTGYDSRIWESISHFYDLQAWMPRNIVFINTNVFNRLDPETQELVRTAAAEAEAMGLELSKESTVRFPQEFSKNGMTVEPGSAELKDGLMAVGQDIATEWREKAGEAGAAILDAYNAR